MIARRPLVVLGFVLILLATNLLRFWMGAADPSGSRFITAGGWLFQLLRVALVTWMHVAALRLAADLALPARRLWRIAGGQALWFHGLTLVALAAFVVRGQVGKVAGGFFTPTGLDSLADAASTLAGLAASYAMFLPFQPGFASVMVAERAATVRWSFAAMRGQFVRALATVTALVALPALLRRSGLGLLQSGTAGALALTSSLDAVLSVILILLATAVYWRCAERALRNPDAAAPGGLSTAA